MQYKIPVQIENEDKVFLGLSIRQIGIIMIGAGLAYTIFKKLEPVVGAVGAGIPSGVVAFIGVVIALFRNSEMTFLPFILNLVRLNLNGTEMRTWAKGTDSYSNLRVGYVQPYQAQKGETTETKGITEAYESIEDKLSKL
jgi:hypothetical protein